MEAMIDSKVDNRLMRAMREGAAALPADLGRLHEYLMLIGGLLGEKAVEHEETWALALAAGAEIETLQNLEHAVTDKAIVVPARDLSEVLTKFAIWNALVAAGAADEDRGDRDRLIRSIRNDVERIARGGGGGYRAEQEI
jgi:hypothetical protein